MTEDQASCHSEIAITCSDGRPSLHHVTWDVSRAD